MDCHFLLQGIFPTQGLNPGLLHCGQTLYHLSHQGSPTPLKQAAKVPREASIYILCRPLYGYTASPSRVMVLLSRKREQILGVSQQSWLTPLFLTWQCHLSSIPVVLRNSEMMCRIQYIFVNKRLNSWFFHLTG